MQLRLCLFFLSLCLLPSLSASAAGAPRAVQPPATTPSTPASSTTTPSETNFTFQYSNDSDGVTSRGMKMTDANTGRPLTYTFYYTRLGQKFQPDITEKTLVFKWVRPLAKEANLTVWGGYLKNDLRSFVPGAVMYDKSVSDTQHVWLSAGRESIGTIPANRQGLFRRSVSSAYQWKTAPGAYLSVNADHWFYSDQNREQQYQLSYKKQLSSRFDLSAVYSYHDAKFESPGIYWVPQQEQTFSIAPRYSMPLGDGTLSLTLQKALWAKNKDGSLTHHEVDINYHSGHFTTGFHFLRDGDYNSRNYTLDYRLFL